MISWQRLTYILLLALAEATPAAVPLVLAGGAGAWGLLLMIVLAGALADWLASHWLRLSWQRPALLGLGLLAGLWMAKIQLGGGAGPLDGWGMVLERMRTGERSTGLAYLTLLIGLYAFRRGTRLLDHDSTSLRNFFWRAAMMLLLVLGLVSLFRIAPAQLALVTLMLLTFFAIGLLTIVLGAAAEEHDSRLKRFDWRSLLSVAGAILIVLLAGALVATLFGKDAAQGIGAIARGAGLLLLLILTPFIMLLVAIMEQLAQFIHLDRALKVMSEQQLAQQALQQQAQVEVLGIFPHWLQMVIQIGLAMLPLLVIALLYLLMRRRARNARDRDEERESLWSWQTLSDDLRDLLASLRRAHPADDLRSALAALRTNDPDSRIRRSYIRLLLLGHAQQRPRGPSQTAQEYEPGISEQQPSATPAIHSLTSAYERARYHPGATTPADADSAERDWRTIDAAQHQPKPRK